LLSSRAIQKPPYYLNILIFPSARPSKNWNTIEMEFDR
jgi:hypothetical protein